MNACAAWNDQGKVQMWNLSSALIALENLSETNRNTVLQEKPLFTFSGHQGEGFAMDWSGVALGKQKFTVRCLEWVLILELVI